MQTTILSTASSSARAGRGGGDGVVRLELDHGPQHDPERLDGGLRDRELVEEVRRHPERRLVAREEVVAERLDDAVRGAPDVRGTFLAQQVEQLFDEPADAAQDDPVAADDRRARGVMRPEQLVGRVDEVELHARQDVGPTTSTPADCICSMARLSSPARRLTGMHRWASTEVSNPSRRASMAVALTQ